ncbi:hypothetical protein MIND_00635300 [Mycena indigotica]|uniref:Uncharacterized protein n=1 Tax=Mycena indigotica TaxID=2126181 RepID=A0A8H6SQA1_9AGAR|nr:uncharacterized protein MIND_00635300 [Mycena indigotica]KAF7304040.1 hypothetical protein MIND_00635300 [Mycena indigotica]
MPARRRRYSCIHAVPEPAPRTRATRPKPLLSEAERIAAKAKRAQNKVLREARKLWEAALPDAWTEPGSSRSAPFRHPRGTHVMYRSDAKKAFGLTEREILTLPHETIPCAWAVKTYFALRDIRALHHRKVQADAHAQPQQDMRLVYVRVLERTGTRDWQTQKNYDVLGEMTLFEYDRRYSPEGVAKRKREDAERKAVDA